MSNFQNDETIDLIGYPNISVLETKKVTTPISLVPLSPLELFPKEPKIKRRKKRTRDCPLAIHKDPSWLIIIYFMQTGDCDFYAKIDTNLCKSFAEYRKSGEAEKKEWTMILEKTSHLSNLKERLYFKKGDIRIRTWSQDEEYWLRIFRKKFWLSIKYVAMLLGRTLASVRRKCIYVEATTSEVI